MAMPLRRGNVVKVVDVLSLPLCPEGLFKCLKCDRNVVINSHKLAVIEYSLGGDWGSPRVPGMSNANVEFGDV